MKKIVTLIIGLVIFSQIAKAQTADEIINKYFEKTGGKDKWAALKTVKMSAKLKVQGMEIPYFMLQKAPNLQKSMYVFQGKEMIETAFDGNEAWGQNQMTMKAEKKEAEDSDNMKNEMDIPDPFLDYAKKGYSVALEGEETIEGTACYKIKLTKKPVKIDGKDEENFTYYFFDKDNGVPIMARSFGKKGQMKGIAQEIFMSDYQEVAGLYYPFTLQIKVNGQLQVSIAIEKVEPNIVIDDKDFAFPKN